MAIERLTEIAKTQPLLEAWSLYPEGQHGGCWTPLVSLADDTTAAVVQIKVEPDERSWTVNEALARMLFARHRDGGDQQVILEADNLYPVVDITIAEISEGVPVALFSAGPRTCRVCGCTDDNACAGGCTWADWDLCTSCTNNTKETP
jgi:hypothetical protein